MRSILPVPLVALLASTLAVAPPVGAQQLSIERIFASDDFRPATFSAQWTNDGASLVLVETNEQTEAADVWVQGIRTNQRTRLVDGATLLLADSTRPVQIEETVWSPDGTKLLLFSNSQRVWRQNTKGLYSVYDTVTRRLTPVSTEPGWQQFAKFSPDGSRIGFVRDGDLFVVELASGRETRLTSDGGETVVNGVTDWVYEEELDLRDAWRWSPDGRRIAFWRFDQSPIPFYRLENNLATPYPEVFTYRYPKAGEPNSKVRLGVIDAGGGAPTWLPVGDDPDVYLPRMDWLGADTLAVQRMNRHQNRVELLLAPADGRQPRTVLTESDSAWVDIDDDLTWLDDGRFVWSSERDGFNHLYLFDRAGKFVRQLTRGDWDVTSLEGVDRRGGWVYFTSTESGPAERQLYRVNLDGSGKRRISTEPGTHGISFNPDFSVYVDAWSRAGQPPVYTLRAANGAAIQVPEDNAALAARLREAGVQPLEFMQLPAADGTPLNAWIIKPPNFDRTKKYPLLLYVYGGPGSQTVTDAWGGSRYLWHQLLAQRGYLVASVDNRGTGGRGRDFKKQTYLRLGELESADQISAAKDLAKLPYVDAGRIGIWGWSYGGYMTALTMAVPGGEIFQAGISVAPVTDWRLYDNIYTERFMRTPAENPEGYRASAPIHHAEGIDGDVLLVHGTGDDNVHAQNTVQMVNALEAANKQFGLMIYPNRTHSISGGNTQLHLFTLMTRWITEKL
ncbi:S9 family peptidase [soil metagenome]